MSDLSDAIDALVTEVEEQKTVVKSAVTYIQGVPALVQAGYDAGIAAGATPAQLQVLKDTITGLNTAEAELTAALTANTPPV